MNAGSQTHRSRLRLGLGLLMTLAGLPAAASTILPIAVETIELPRPDRFNGTTPMGIAWHPGFDQYYGANGGNRAFSGFSWDAGGTLLQTQTPVGVDVRGVNYNPSSDAVEAVTFGANSGSGSPGVGLVQMGLDATGLYVGSTTNVLTSLPGLDGNQTVPAYDPTRGVLYSRGLGSDGSVNVVNRADGSLLDTIALDLAAAGSPNLQGAFIGFDPEVELLVAIDRVALEALAFDLDGGFVGGSLLSAFDPTQSSFNAGYANGQLFAFDESINAYRGYTLFEPADSTAAAAVPEPAGLLVAGLIPLALSRRRLGAACR